MTVSNNRTGESTLPNAFKRFVPVKHPWSLLISVSPGWMAIPTMLVDSRILVCSLLHYHPSIATCCTALLTHAAKMGFWLLPCLNTFSHYLFSFCSARNHVGDASCGYATNRTILVQVLPWVWTWLEWNGARLAISSTLVYLNYACQFGVHWAMQMINYHFICFLFAQCLWQDVRYVTCQII